MKVTEQFLELVNSFLSKEDRGEEDWLIYSEKMYNLVHSLSKEEAFATINDLIELIIKIQNNKDCCYMSFLFLENVIDRFNVMERWDERKVPPLLKEKFEELNTIFNTLGYLADVIENLRRFYGIEDPNKAEK